MAHVLVPILFLIASLPAGGNAPFVTPTARTAPVVAQLTAMQFTNNEASFTAPDALPIASFPAPSSFRVATAMRDFSFEREQFAFSEVAATAGITFTPTTAKYSFLARPNNAARLGTAALVDSSLRFDATTGFTADSTVADPAARSNAFDYSSAERRAISSNLPGFAPGTDTNI